MKTKIITRMKLKMKKDVLIAAIIRGGAHRGTVLIPRGSDKILPGDSVVVVSHAKTIDDIGDILE